ncbi:MAG: hypothetical protein U1F12_11105 [Pseudomonadales bacterium]|jgi:antitoxin component YwqK of YwqJK toxin-antitoxin module/uncharacterized protein YecT (DUF1311 family)
MKRFCWMPVVLVVIGLFGCGKEVDYREIQSVNGLMYKLNDSDPYTGIIKDDPLLMSEIYEDSFTYKAILDVQSGSICTSEVVHGKYDGKKVCQLKGNKVAEIEYKNGLLNGVRKLWSDKNGKLIFETSLKDGKKDGENVVFNPETGEKAVVENYAAGKLHGQQKIFMANEIKNPILLKLFAPDEVISDLDWKDGKKTGKTSTFLTAGIEEKDGGKSGFVGKGTIIEENWKAGLLDGSKKVYLFSADNPKDRTLRNESAFKEGKPIGIHTEFYSGDQILRQKKYDDDGVPKGGFDRVYYKGKVLSEVSLVPVMSGGKIKFGKNGLEKNEYTDEIGNSVMSETTWKNGYIIERLVKKTKGGVPVSESRVVIRKSSTGEAVMPDLDTLYADQADNLVFDGPQKEYSGGVLLHEIIYSNGVVVDKSYNSATGVLSEKSMSSVDDSKVDERPFGQTTASESLQIKSDKEPSSVILPGPSFDCAKAATSIEKMICSDTYIGNLDGILSHNYKALFGDEYGFDEAGKKSTKDEQKAWMVKRNACATKECVIDAYKSRIDEICEIPVASGVNDCQSWTSLSDGFSE